MARHFHPVSVKLLEFLARRETSSLSEVKLNCCPQFSEKNFYNYIFRLQQQELVSKIGQTLSITPEGLKLLKRLSPKKDNVWKLVIFDIPEKHKYVRVVLRSKLKQLGFKKWQNSIWISPYELDQEIEDELTGLGEKYFVRLIKTTQINHSEGLDKMFA
jgi:CRISPR/Cas system-associated endoribonuclease Cas2